MRQPSALFFTGLLSLLIWAAIIMLYVFLFVGCSLTINPDGSKEVIIDGSSLIEILATK